jgi:hypothetical protein
MNSVDESDAFTLPGYNYLGPGNPLFNGEPTSKLDKVARAHDIEYNLSRSAEDIREADLRFLSRLHNCEGEHCAKYTAYCGIGIKYALESLTGPLYPWTILSQRLTSRLSTMGFEMNPTHTNSIFRRNSI